MSYLSRYLSRYLSSSVSKLLVFAGIVSTALVATPEVEAQLRVQWTQPPAEIGDLVAMVAEPGYFEEASEFLNGVVRFPREVPVIFQNCGVPNAFYHSDHKQITICYELSMIRPRHNHP